MTILIIGLILFLGIHSVRIVAPVWRTQQMARMGENAWKGIYSLVSLAGFALIIWGYGAARAETGVLWVAPAWMRHVVALGTLIAFVLIVAAYVPRNHFKAAIGHPMVAGVKVWAFVHLLAAGRLHAVILFATFLAWAVLAFVSMRKRDRAAGVVYPAGTMRGTMITLVVGAVAWAVFALYLHGWLIGVKPFG